MGPKKNVLIAAFFASTIVLTEPVIAQYSQVRTSRPSTAGPSSRVGITGGIGTRDTGARSLRGRTGMVEPSAVRLPSTDDMRRGSPLPPNLMPAAFLVGTPGFKFERPGNNPFRTSNPLDLERLSRVAGMRRTLQHSRPLLPKESVFPVMARGPYYAKPVDREGFSGLFDLKPWQGDETTEPTAANPKPVLTYGELLDRENAAHLQRTKDRAAAALKRGTTPRVEDPGEHLSRASDLLAQILRTDETDPLPALLSVHTALQKRFIVVAGRSLMELVRRDPEFFLRENDVAQYFGDPRFLDNQMRQYRGIGEANPRDPYAWAIQAYCNWMLGDATRTRQSIQQMRRAGFGNSQTRAFGYSLSAALSSASE